MKTFHAWCATAVLLAFTAPAHAHPQPPAEPFVLEIEALIDGRDELIVRSDTLQWHHFDFAAVGRISGGNAPTIVAPWDDQTQTEWIPTWSEPVPNEIRFEDASSTLELLNPPLPQNGRPVYLQKLFGRGNVRITQQPTEANGYTLIVEFDDNEYPGARYYGIRLTSELDTDGDGVPDERDQCPSSDLRPSVQVDGTVCSPDIPNKLLADGCTFNDKLAACENGARCHRDFVRCVEDRAREWKRADLITSKQQGALKKCADH